MSGTITLNNRAGAYAFLAFFLIAFVGLSKADNGGKLFLLSDGNHAVIGNEFMTREFSLKDGRVRTLNIINKCVSPVPAEIIPQESSEEFILGTLDADSAVTEVRSSELSLDRVQCNDGSEDEKELVFHYKPFRHKGVDWQVNMVLAMQKGKHYMRKYLEISVPESQRSLARLDYIDFESMKLPADYAVWTHPEMESGVGGVSGYYISLGQPVYVQAMFFGLEFPAAESEISADRVTRIRYYSGKNFEQLADEGRLKDGVLSTWKEVIGATRSTELDVIQTDFFSYIDDISVPVKLRMQYNSWYDFMMNIDETNILDSFREIERGLTQNGVRPLDSYVVDDGWNAYGPWEKENEAKFWSFNSKFPHELEAPSNLAHQLSSDFGLWLGPRGGYGYNSRFAKFLEENGNGKWNQNSNDVCTNHKVYLQKLQAFFLDCQKKFDINYWKLDGFMVRPPQPDSLGNYISGGKQGMYYVTEHWERWIDILSAMRDERGAKKDDLWINLTCYVNPSPWFLQWANSVWMQNSTDIGRLDVGRKAQLDQLLSYRDDRYFDFVKTRAFQFPLSHLYNHDPIYGKTAKLAGKMDDDEFRTYLLMMATRGTAFWELYYSYDMMNEGRKWEINAEVLRWICDNYGILKNAKLIGTTPAKGTPYGFSSWEGNEGIISVRNPSGQVQDFTITLDRTIGMPEGLEGLYRVPVWAFHSSVVPAKADNRLYRYGEQMSFTLQPGEVLIWKFATTVDRAIPPSLSSPLHFFGGGEIPASVGMKGSGDFNLSFVLKAGTGTTMLLHQGQDISVELNSEKKIVFHVKDLKVVSRHSVNREEQLLVSLCREKNGMLKIYINGELDNSVYDEKKVNVPVNQAPLLVNPSSGNVLEKVEMLDRALDFKENRTLMGGL